MCFCPPRGLLAANGLRCIESYVRLSSPGGKLSAGDDGGSRKHLKGIVRSGSVNIRGRCVNMPPLFDSVDLKIHLGLSNLVIVDGTLVLVNLRFTANTTSPFITTLVIKERDSREMRHLVRSKDASCKKCSGGVGQHVDSF